MVLCQNCLKVKFFTDDRHLGVELCECGCQDCVSTIEALRSGKRKADDILCQSDIEQWSEAGGVGGPL